MSKVNSNWKWLPVIALTLLLGIFFVKLLLPKLAQSFNFSTQAFPKFKLTALQDPQRELTEADLPQGQIWILTIWSSWCTVCRQEHEWLVQHPQKNLYSLVYADDRQRAIAWLAEHGDPYQLSIFDPQMDLAAELNINGIPVTLIIDQKNQIRFRHVGAINDQVWESKIAPWLAKLSQ